VTPRSGSELSDKKWQQPTAVMSKLGKMGKQSEDQLVAGMKRSFESDSDDDDDDDDDDDADEVDDDDDDLPAVKKKQPVAEGIFTCFDCCFTYCKKICIINARTHAFSHLKPRSLPVWCNCTWSTN